MKTIQTFIKNKSNILNILFIPFIIYSFFLLIFTIQGVPTLLIIRDLAQTCNQTLGVGFISNLGIIIWIGISSILIFIIKVGVSKKSQYNNLIKTGCIFSCFLALDDFFLIHDKYVIQELIFLSYFILIFYIIKKFFTQIKELAPNLFLTSLVLFGLSIIIDIVLQDLFPSFLIITQIIEEGCKFMGIFCWASFWWTSASKILKSQKFNNL